MSFLPINLQEATQRGWDELDVIFVSGDAYIDHPSFGVPLLARLLEAEGLRVGIIAQPDWRNIDAFRVLGRPRLFFAVAAGAMDSMVAHYTPARKLRRDDAYTPGNSHGARPNRATIVYTSCCKAAYKDVPVVIGGIEASLRRFAHYDYWDDRVRRSILFDSKADLLVYGMGETPLLELVRRLCAGEDFFNVRDIRGTAIVTSGSALHEVQHVPSFEEVAGSKTSYATAFKIISTNLNPYVALPLVQAHGNRLLLCNPPALPLSTEMLDRIYALKFSRLPHPSYVEKIVAWEQIKTSVTSHRGCYGGCAFCAITMHQGKFIQSRSMASILNEVADIVSRPWAKGVISDVGGPTANMYGTHCGAPDEGKSCRRTSCLYPTLCSQLRLADELGAGLLRRLRTVGGVRSCTVSSGIRYDMLLRQPAYMKELLRYHVGGLLKVAPEHLSDVVTRFMHKPGAELFIRFLELFRQESRAMAKRQAIVPYFIASHPGCTMNDMVDLALKLKSLGLRVEQIQDFTPTPGTLSTCMYYTGIDPLSSKELHVPRTEKEKRLQKSLLLSHLSTERQNVLAALNLAHRKEAIVPLLGNRFSGFTHTKVHSQTKK
jgi:uncharacterized radical SAM protein YgiQ